MARNKGEVDAVLYIAHLNIPVGGEITDSNPGNPGCYPESSLVPGSRIGKDYPLRYINSKDVGG
jgi:hypothetical protein